MRRILALLATVVLSGCGVWSSTIRSDVVDYSNAIAETTDQFLLINILEARDDAPLHFVAIPNIHGSLQASATLSSSLSLPTKVGSSASGVVSQTLTPSASVQSAPSFEVDSVETKDFVTGMTSPIDAKYIKYWVDRGLDKRIILLLFFSSAQITENVYAPIRGDTDCQIKAATVGKSRKGVKKPGDEALCTKTIVVFDAPRSAADQLITCRSAHASDWIDRCHQRTQFEHYLSLADAVKDDISANGYSERRPLSEPFVLQMAANLKNAGSLDPKKLQLEYRKDRKYMLYAVSDDQSVVLCYKKTNALRANEGDDTTKLCSLSVVDKDPVDPHPSATHDLLIAPATKASSSGDCSGNGAVDASENVGEGYCGIFRAFLCYAEAHAIGDAAGIRDDGCPDAKTWHSGQFTLQFTTRSVGEIIRFLGDLVYFQEQLGSSDVHHNIPVTLGYAPECRAPNGSGSKDCQISSGGWLFNLDETGAPGRLSVNYRDRTYSLPNHAPYDHSLEVLSIVNQLVNLNKSATDLRTTPTVQVVP